MSVQIDKDKYAEAYGKAYEGLQELRNLWQAGEDVYPMSKDTHYCYAPDCQEIIGRTFTFCTDCTRRLPDRIAEQIANGEALTKLCYDVMTLAVKSQPAL